MMGEEAEAAYPTTVHNPVDLQEGDEGHIQAPEPLSSMATSQSSSITGGPTWRWNEQGNYAEYRWDGNSHYKGDWAEEYQKWYTSYKDEWYYW